MYLSIDIPLMELLKQILQNNSPHAVLYFLAELERHPDPDEFANKAAKLLEPFTKPELFE